MLMTVIRWRVVAANPDRMAQDRPIRGRHRYRAESERPTKYIFITGGVVSSLGKGICASALGLLLKKRGLTIKMLKLDPYLNVDPGTMNPYQHGEVYVLDDGSETADQLKKALTGNEG